MRISDWSSDVCSSDLIAVPDPKWGERPLAVIVAKADAIPTLEIINAPVERAIASGEITRYAKLDRFRIVDQLPRTSVGKIDKKQLRALYAEQVRSEEHTSELQSLMRISYAVFCLK